MRASSSDPILVKNRSADHVLDVARQLGSLARPLRGDAPDLDPLLDAIGDARFVLIGEATHGTHEFYALRAAITQRLIVQKSFDMVAVVGDWPDANRVNRYVHGLGNLGNADDARAALGASERFPSWRWRNPVVLAFARWLRLHNQLASRDVGFHGLDLFSRQSSIDAAIHALESLDPALARDARGRFGCFGAFGGEPTLPRDETRPQHEHPTTRTSAHGRACEDAVVEQLVRHAAHRIEVRGMGVSARDDLFVAERAACVRRDAEAHYRALYRGGIHAWNARDTHMADTLAALVAHFGGHEDRVPSKPARATPSRVPKIVIWAHNAHVGDARATELGARGELSLGELVRTRYPGESFSLGLSTYEGSVTAARQWGGCAERTRITRALAGSHEELFHHAPARRFMVLPEALARMEEFATPRLQRAIGVTYDPRTERASHYFRTTLAAQFDALVHIDETRAVEPLTGFD